MPFLGTRGAGSNRAFGYAAAAKPNQVTGLTATDFGTARAFNNGRIDLSWSAPANNGATISGYLIQRSTDNSTYSTLVANTGTSATTYSDVSLNSSQIYYYKVSAINAAGTSDASTAASATATTVPQAPVVTAANVGTGRAYNNGAATITATGGATGGKSISSYTATSSPGSFTATSGSPLTVTGLQSATSYTFSVTATNANGTSTATTSGSITATTVPQAPTIGTATPGGAKATVTFTTNATGGSAITSYTATSSPGGITGSGSSSPVTVNGLTPGTAYTFTVTATNANGASTASAASNSVTPTQPSFFALYGTSGSTGDQSYQTAVDGSGNIYFAGSLNNFTYGYISKMNSVGTLLWQRQFGNGSATTYINDIAIDSAGDIILAGRYQGVGTLLLKYNSSGVLQWQKTYGSGELYRVVVDSSNNIYVATTQSSDSFILKLDSSGNITWQRRSANVTPYSTSIAVDGSGNVWQGTANIISKWNSSGTLQFSRSITGGSLETGGNYLTSLRGLVADSSGNIYIAYLYDAGVQTYNYFAILIKLNSSGTLQWQRRPGNGNVSSESTIALDSTGSNVYFASPATNSYYSGQILKYNSSGVLQWQRLLRPTNNSSFPRVQAKGISVDSNFFYAAGYYQTSQADSSQYDALIVKMPLDGSLTGAYALPGPGLTYEVSTAPEAAGSAAVSSFSLNTATPTLTASNTSISESAASQTISVTSA